MSHDELQNKSFLAFFLNTLQDLKSFTEAFAHNFIVVLLEEFL
jgi:hypothetical protein